MAKRSGLTIGVDLGGTNVRAGLVSRDRLLKLDSKAIRGKGTAEEVFEDLCSVIDAVIEKKVSGIGIGIPSLVDEKTGSSIDATNIPAWTKFPLRRRLEKRYRVPIHINNDANCFALGEKYFGAAKAAENFVGLITGTGLGAGIIVRGRLHSGVDCGAGEFGLIPYQDSIIEHYAAGQFFQKRGFNGADIAAAAAKGDTQALALFDEYGQHLGHAIKIILLALAPELIVLGGSVSLSYPLYKASLERSLADFNYPTVAKKLKIKISKLKNVAVLGAASLVFDERAL